MAPASFSSTRSSEDHSAEPGTKIINPDEYDMPENKVLGESPMAKVYSGSLIKTERGRLVAVKIPRSKMSKLLIKHEAGMYSYLKDVNQANKFIVGFHGLDLSNMAIVLDRMKFSLAQCTESIEGSQQRADTIDQTFPFIATGIVNCLSWLHNVAKVVHGDIKPSNFLLQHNPFVELSSGTGTPTMFTVVLSDFGTARKFNDNVLTDGGNTWEYMAPERMNFRASQTPSTLEADIWATGISLLTLITGRTPYQELSGPRQWALISQGNPISNEANVSLELEDRIKEAGRFVKFIRAGLKKDPEERIKAKEWCEAAMLLNGNANVL